MSIEKKKNNATPQGITGLSCGWQPSEINLSTRHKLFKQKSLSTSMFCMKKNSNKKGRKTPNPPHFSPQGQSCCSLP